MLVQRRDAVPDVSRQPDHQIGRARLNRQENSLPSLADFLPEPEGAGREERDADHLVEMRLVPIPADPGAGSVRIARTKPQRQGLALNGSR